MGGLKLNIFFINFVMKVLFINLEFLRDVNVWEIVYLCVLM